MSFVQGEESSGKIPVALGIKGKNLYLSCVMKDEKPTLLLEVSEYQNGSPFLLLLKTLRQFTSQITLFFSPHPTPGKSGSRSA
jgi:hypothetical protein